MVENLAGRWVKQGQDGNRFMFHRELSVWREKGENLGDLGAAGGVEYHFLRWGGESLLSANLPGKEIPSNVKILQLQSRTILGVRRRGECLHGWVGKHYMNFGYPLKCIISFHDKCSNPEQHHR